MQLIGEVINIDTRIQPYMLLLRNKNESVIEVNIPFDAIDIARKLKAGFIATIEAELLGKQYWDKAQKRLRGYNSIVLIAAIRSEPKEAVIIEKESRTKKLVGVIESISPMVGLMVGFRRTPITVKAENGRIYEMDLRDDDCFAVKTIDMWVVRFEIEYFKTAKKGVSPYQIVKIKRI